MPQCGGELEAPDEAVGKKVKCPDCGTRIAVPPAEEKPARSAKSAIQPTPVRRPPPSDEPADEEEIQEEPRRRRRREEESDDEDEDDDRPRRRRRRLDADDDDGVSTLIPYKNTRALMAYYCGVFSLIPCLGLLLGPAALILGLLALRFVKEHPSAKGAGHAWAGIILGSLTSLGNWGVAILALVGGGIAAFAR